MWKRTYLPKMELSKCLTMRLKSPPFVTKSVEPTPKSPDLEKKELKQDKNSKISRFWC